jgi:hypothetical protein
MQNSNLASENKSANALVVRPCTDFVLIPTPISTAIERRNFFEQRWANPAIRAHARRHYSRPNLPIEVRDE